MPANSDPQTAELVPVTQADRDAAAEYTRLVGWSPNDIAAIRTGARDAMPSVQAFARHRLAPAPASSVGEGIEDRRRAEVAAEQAAVEGYIADYVLSTEGPDYEPTDFERELIGDALQGWLADRERLMAEHGFSETWQQRHAAALSSPDRAPAPADLVEAFEPFLAVRDQYPETIKLINPKLDGMEPITVTVTKAQFLAAFNALAALRSPDDLAKGRGK